MAGTVQNEMQCAEFEALLSDALDGVLAGGGLERFQAHCQSCALCGVMFAEAETGKAILRGLEEAEPPRHLVNRILAATSGVQPARQAATEAPGWRPRLRGWAMPALRPLMQPRFAMSFAMAFFSVSIMLNLAGLRLADLRYVDLRPSAVRDNTVRTYQETTARVMKYYENLRWVYEIESRVRELKNAATPAETSKPPKDKQKRNQNDNTSGQPEQNNQERYSLEFAEATWALIAGPAL